MSSVEETLAWEAQWRPRAAAAAIGGAVAGLAGGVMLIALTGRGPEESDGFVSIVESLRGAAEGVEPTERSLVVRQVEDLGDKAPLLTTSTVLTVLGVLGLLGALTYLFRATRARNADVSRLVGWSIAFALALYPLGRGLREISGWIGFAGFDPATETPGDARELSGEGAGAVGLILESLGGFALALAVVLVALNAMRVGLLTRFMGILGIIVGALVVFELDQPQFVRWIWLVFVGLLIAGRYPGGSPPAWETGRAEPWPTQQQLREQRGALRDAPEAPEAPAEQREPVEGEEGYEPGAARRKRKKRR